MGEGEEGHRVEMAAFSIARYPVAHADYQAFIEELT